ncbi:WXG100 family type VII secretion target [Actinoplanes sp. RD1]|uniref:hypothetical protein n=1 Tax=Actinoplanes sp. RD1 TaxID=3064538 RepID=UPI002740F067|nr:hypothetical protein [Actinoplanes sp. RD1]
MADWKNDVDKDATFKPSTVDTSNPEDYNAWKNEDRGWRKLEAALRGGAALDTAEGQAVAATLVSPQSLADSAAVFHKIRNALVWLESFVKNQVGAVAGPDRAWQGAAADAFITKMNLLADSIGENAERINGGDVHGPNSVPESLYRSAYYLKWGQEQILHLDVSYADIAHKAGVGDGHIPVPISGSKFEKPMAEQMAQVVKTVADQYHSTYDQVQAPTEGTVPLPTNVTTTNHTTPKPLDITTPPPITTPKPIDFTTTPPVNITTPPPISITPPVTQPLPSITPPATQPLPSVTPPVTQPVPEIAPPGGNGPEALKTPEIEQPPGGDGLGGTGGPSTMSAFKAPELTNPEGGDGLGGGVDSPVSATDFQAPELDTAPSGEGLPGLGGNGATSPAGSGAFVPPVVGNAPGAGNGLGGPSASGNSVKLPTSGDAGSLTGDTEKPGSLVPGNGDFEAPSVAAPPGGAGGGLGSSIPGADGIDIPGVSSPSAGDGLGGGAGSGSSMPMMPGAGGGGAGAGGGGIPDASDASGLLTGDQDDWTAPAIGAVDVPDAPLGAAPGGASGLGQSPMMPGSPGAGGGGAGSGSGIPDASDASGLVEGDAGDWTAPEIGGIDVPDAPSGTAPGGSGLGQSPMMPGSPGAGAGPGTGGSGIPDASDSSGLVEGDAGDWTAPEIGGIDVPDAPSGTAPGGSGLGQTPMMPGSPGTGGGPGSTGSGSVEAPDSQGLVTGDLDTWQPSGSDYELPGSPGGAEAGGAGLTVPEVGSPGGAGSPIDGSGMDLTVPEVEMPTTGDSDASTGAVPATGAPPMMPGGAPGGGAQPGTGTGIPDAPDAQGLVDADLSDWKPAGGELGDPSAPQGTAAGGAGLEVPGWDQPGTADPITGTTDDVTAPEQEPADQDSPREAAPATQAGAVPAMPGAPGSSAPPTAGSVPDASGASELIDPDAADWQPTEVSTDPYAPTGAAAGGAGLQASVDVPPPAAPIESVVSLPDVGAPTVGEAAPGGSDWFTVSGPETTDPGVIEAPATNEQPVAEQPVAEQPVTEQPVAEQPVAEQPVADQPVVEQPVAEQPVVEQPVVEQPVAQEPVVQEPVVQEPVAQEPAPAAEPAPAEPVQQEGTPLQESPPAATDGADGVHQAVPPQHAAATIATTATAAAAAAALSQPAASPPTAPQTGAGTGSGAGPGSGSGPAAGPHSAGDDDAATILAGTDEVPEPIAPAIVLNVPQAVGVPTAPPVAAASPAGVGREAAVAGTVANDPRLAGAVPGQLRPVEDDRETPERPGSAELLQDETGAWQAAGQDAQAPPGDDFVPVVAVDDDDMSGWDDVDDALWLTEANGTRE